MGVAAAGVGVRERLAAAAGWRQADGSGVDALRIQVWVWISLLGSVMTLYSKPASHLGINITEGISPVCLE